MKWRNIHFVLTILVGFSLTLSACKPTETPVAEEPTAAEPVVEEPTEAPPPTEKPTEAPPPEPVTLTLMTNWGPDDAKGPPLQGIIDEFMEANPDIKIDVEIVPENPDIPVKVETAFLAGLEPDLILMNFPFGGTDQWVPDGVAIPVTDLIGEWGMLDLFLDGAIAEYTRDGEIQAFPLEGFNWPVWYNKEILDAAGVEAIPSTYAELTDAAAKIRDAGYQPFTIGNDWSFGDFVVISMIATLDPDQVEVLQKGGFSENESARRLVEALIEMREAGVFADDAEGMETTAANELFYTGQAGIMFGGSWFYGTCPEDMRSKVVLGGMPTWDGSGVEKPFWWNRFGAKAVWISRNGSQKLEQVEKFVKFLFTPEMIGRFVEVAGMIPPLKEVTIDESKLNPIFVESLKLSGELLAIPGPRDIPSSIIGASGWYNVTPLILIPDTTADEVLEAIDELYEQLE